MSCFTFLLHDFLVCCKQDITVSARTMAKQQERKVLSVDFKNAIQNISKSHEKDTLNTLYTPWSEHLDPAHVWEEYPRPQMRREDYHMLNGYWDYQITSDADTTIIPGTPFIPQGQILVPFSPESLLSGVNRQLQPDEYLWYQRVVTLEQPAAPLSRCLLHFDAVDQEADVYINGKHAAHHLGGYLPFTVELQTATMTQSGKALIFLIQVRVKDVSDTSWHARGKQTLKRGGMFYTAQSGIWQSVWYEWVPEQYIKTMTLTPDYDLQSCELILKGHDHFRQISLTTEEGIPYPVSAVCRETDKDGNPFTCICFSLPSDMDFLPWTPDTPYLYPLVIHADEDIVHSYFAMRCYTVEKDEHDVPRFCLNHKPLFLHGILDQGYWPDGLMTAPCDEAFIYDIELVKNFGFNMIRKHIKIEPLRWYYHCDRLGMIVWQDMVNGGTAYHMGYVCYLPTLLPGLAKKFTDNHYGLLSRKAKEGREEWLAECIQTIRHLYNVPSLAVWVPFNEAWGQFDAAKVCAMVQKEDPTRPVDHASGWFDQKCGDFRSIHNYFRPLKAEAEKKRACVISEYGGYACHIPGHSSVNRVYGYQKYDSREDLTKAYTKLIREQLLPLEAKGLSGAVYTQLSDIEEEVNGLVTYDRRVVKIGGNV